MGVGSFRRMRRTTAEKEGHHSEMSGCLTAERPAGVAIQLKRGAGGEANAGNNSWRLTARNNVGQKFVSLCGLWWSLLFLCGLP